MAAPDFSPILSAADLSTVSSVVMSIAAMLAAVYVVHKGLKLVIRSIMMPGSGARISSYEWEGNRIEAGEYVPRSVFESHAPGMEPIEMKRYAKRAAKNGWW